jgi:hypothetical protein
MRRRQRCHTLERHHSWGLSKEKQPMNVIGMNMYPHIELLEENRRELERERRLRQQIREARAAQRAQRPSRFAALITRMRRALQPIPCPPTVEDC